MKKLLIAISFVVLAFPANGQMNFSRKFAVDTLWKFTAAEITVLNRMSFLQQLYSDTVSSKTTFVLFPDSVKITGYGFLNNIEAYSGDMVAIRDTARTSSTMGIGSITGTIDSALTIFSGADYGGIHARGLLLSGGADVAGAGVFRSGSVTITGPSVAQLNIEPASGNAASIYWKNASTQHWHLYNDPAGPFLELDYQPSGDNKITFTSTSILINDPLLFLTDNTFDIGAAGATRPKDLYLAGNANIGGLTASRLTATDASKNLVSTITSANAALSVSDETGSDAMVFANTPTLVTPNIGAATGTSVNLTGAGTFGATSTDAVFINGVGFSGYRIDVGTSDWFWRASETQMAWGSVAAGDKMQFDNTALYPATGGGITLGKSGNRWGTFYGGDGDLSGSLTVTGAGSVGGKFTAADTIRSGNFTTYSYFIPGGALVQSSTESIKDNIRNYTADLKKFSLVKPKRYNFKQEAFIRLFDESTLPDSLSEKEKGDIRKKFREDNLKEATEKSKREMVGFLAEEFNSILGKDSKEINQQDVINVMWLKIQELEARIKRLE